MWLIPTMNPQGLTVFCMVLACCMAKKHHKCIAQQFYCAAFRPLQPLLQGGPELLLPSEMCLLGLASEWGYI